jgi:hypothetical protein
MNKASATLAPVKSVPARLANQKFVFVSVAPARFASVRFEVTLAFVRFASAKLARLRSTPLSSANTSSRPLSCTPGPSVIPSVPGMTCPLSQWKMSPRAAAAQNDAANNTAHTHQRFRQLISPLSKVRRQKPELNATNGIGNRQSVPGAFCRLHFLPSVCRPVSLEACHNALCVRCLYRGGSALRYS